MKTPIYILISLVFVAGFSGCRRAEDQAHDALSRSVAWLWSQQGADGGWHSQTHAVLKDGKALTPYILYYLLQVPDDVYPKPAAGVENALTFVQREIRASMEMGPDSLPILNYPNYSAAYALRVLKELDRDTVLQRLITDHLLSEQFTEHRGIHSDHLSYGGWGYGEPGLLYGQHGHVDISHTRRIVEALLYKAEAEAKAKKMNSPFEGDVLSGAEIGLGGCEAKAEAKEYQLKTFERIKGRGHEYELHISQAARIFMEGVQRSREDLRLYEGCISRAALPYDGGFISSVVTLSTNKSIPVFIEGAGYHYPSYATATCDGYLALHALGMQDTPAYEDARQWLADHQDMHTIEGLSPDDPEQWTDVMHYYHLAVRAEAMTVANIRGSWSSDILSILVREQHPEGFYVNPIGGVNKEDDPMMATVFAIQALYFTGFQHEPMVLSSSN